MIALVRASLEVTKEYTFCLDRSVAIPDEKWGFLKNFLFPKTTASL
jgi:hypothetical protein